MHSIFIEQEEKPAPKVGSVGRVGLGGILSKLQQNRTSYGNYLHLFCIYFFIKLSYFVA